MAALLALLALLAALTFASRWLFGRTAQYILSDLRTRLYDHLQALPLTYFHQRRNGDIVALLTNDVGHLASFISSPLVSVVPLGLTVAGSMVLMLRIDLGIVAIALVMIPLFYLLMKVLTRRLRPLSRELQRALADSVAIADEKLDMLPAIKTYTREPLESNRYRQKIEQVRRLSNQELVIYSALAPGVQFLAAAGMVFIAWLLTIRVGGPGPSRSLADSVTSLLYAALLTRPRVATAISNSHTSFAPTQ